MTFALIDLATLGPRALMVAVIWFVLGIFLQIILEPTNERAASLYGIVWLIPSILFGTIGAITFILFGN
jgi:hypothetical protein